MNDESPLRSPEAYQAWCRGHRLRTDAEFQAAIAETRWAYREWLKAILNRIIRSVVREVISDFVNPRQQTWEEFTAIQSITPAGRRSCNRHIDCGAADAIARANGRRFGAEHCSDPCCEDCFGQ